MPTIPVATRVTAEQLAKARDGLIIKGIAPDQLTTRSQILRLSIFLAITINSNLTKPPSDESLSIVKSL